MMTPSERLIKARASTERSAILYVIDAIRMLPGDKLRPTVASAANCIHVTPEWLVARVATFRKGPQRQIIVAALKTAGMLPLTP